MIRTLFSFVLLISLLFLNCGFSNNTVVLFQDPLDGTEVKGWIVKPDTFIDHPKYGRVYQLKSDSIRLTKPGPWVGDESWTNYRLEVEILPSKERGFIGVNYYMQDEPDFGCNFHFATSDDTLNLQSMSMWGNNKGSWKLWPVSQKTMVVPPDTWIHFTVENGKNFTNIFYQDSCIYTIYDLPYYKGGIRFFSTYYGSALFRNLKITKLPENSIHPILNDIWQESRTKKLIRNWQITEMKPQNYANNTLPDQSKLIQEPWQKAETDNRVILILSAIYPNYSQNTILAKTNILSDKKTTQIAYVTYTDRFSLYCNGELIFKGPDRNWFNSDRSKYGDSRLIPDQFKIQLPLKEGENTIIVRSEVMEDFGWGFWMRLE